MNYAQLGAGIVLAFYVVFLEMRIKELSRQIRLLKVRDEDQEITEKVHIMSDDELNNLLSKHIGGSDTKT